MQSDVFLEILLFFEDVALQLNSSSRAIFLNICRPPKCIDFFDDLFELLSLICTNFDCVLIFDDFNVYVDKPEDRWTKELCCDLDNFALTQQGTQPTHNMGHILDLVISKVLCISKVLVSDVALSDHYCVFFESDITVYTNGQTEVGSKCYITENTGDIFIKAFSSTTPLSRFTVNDFVYHFNSKIAKVIDAIAPTKVKAVSGKKKSPWRNATLVKMGKKRNVKKLSAGGKKTTSRFILTFIKRD